MKGIHVNIGKVLSNYPEVSIVEMCTKVRREKFLLLRKFTRLFFKENFLWVWNTKRCSVLWEVVILWWCVGCRSPVRGSEWNCRHCAGLSGSIMPLGSDHRETKVLCSLAFLPQGGASILSNSTVCSTKYWENPDPICSSLLCFVSVQHVNQTVDAWEQNWFLPLLALLSSPRCTRLTGLVSNPWSGLNLIMQQKRRPRSMRCSVELSK